MDKGARSVPRTHKSFAVAASPFNAVKLTLGIIIAVGILMVLVVGKLAAQPLTQVLVLGTYGIIATTVLVAKTRRVLREQMKSTYSSEEKSVSNDNFEQ